MVYVSKHFDENDPERLRACIRACPLGTLVAMTPSGLEANHIPFVLRENQEGWMLEGHVARANGVWRDALRDQDALAIFHGPNAYVSPSWYAAKEATGMVVPTWNYAVVHVYGRLEFIDEANWVRANVERLTSEHEAGRQPPWAVTDAPADFIEKLTRAIVGVRIPIARMVGKLKLSQNRSAEDQRRVIERLEGEDHSAAREVARWMRERS